MSLTLSTIKTINVSHLNLDAILIMHPLSLSPIVNHDGSTYCNADDADVEITVH